MSMTGKTRLEMEIENIEKVRTPAAVRILILLLLLSLLALGVYTFTLKQDLSVKEQEIVKMKEQLETGR